MPAPSTYGTIATNIDTSVLGDGRYVADGEKWGGGLGTGVTLTFSFPGNGSNGNFANYSDPYPDGAALGTNGEWAGWYSLSAQEMVAVRLALATWQSFANVSFVEVDDGQFDVGELRFTISNQLTGNESAHAYYPYQGASGGDVWFNLGQFDTDGGDVPVGSFDFETILHEIGHALGLKHTFDGSRGGGYTAPAGEDNYFYSVMSYTASPWSAQGDNFASFYPTTPMYFDLVALETMYGRRTFHPGNDTYTFLDGQKYWQAINDTGGVDTIRYVGSEGVTIDLNQGHFSSLSEAIQFRKPDNSAVFSKFTVTIGPFVVIENARGDRGNDILLGNSANNVLTGGLGNDTLKGDAGRDILRGGPGNDRLFGGTNADYFQFNSAPNSRTNHDTVYDYNVSQDTIQVDNNVFLRLGHTGALPSAFFRAGSHALDANDYLIYNKTNGLLYYDDNGSLPGHQVLVAAFAHQPLLTFREFVVV